MVKRGDEPIQIILVDTPPSPRSLAALYASKYTRKQLAAMCGEHGLTTSARTKRELAERLANAPRWTEEVVAERRRSSLSVTIP